jgi:tryptophan-rich sensory protein
MIAVSFVYVAVQTIKHKLSNKIFFVFLANLVANLLYSPIFFGMKNIPLATLDIAVVWITIVMQFFLMWKKHRWVSLLQIPYFLWVSTASVIQFTVFFLN